MNKNRPLEVVIKEGELRIRIGIDTLAFSAAHCPLLTDSPGERVDPFAKITDNFQLARDVKAALMSEREDGSGPLSDLFDEAILKAFEDGSEAFDYKFKAKRIRSA